MTPPSQKISRVDIQALNSLENISSLPPKLLPKLDPKSPRYPEREKERAKWAAIFLKGTDLKLDDTIPAANEEPELITTIGKENTTLRKENAWLTAMRRADINGDHYVDLDETRNMLNISLSPEYAATIPPQKFLEDFQQLMNERYIPLANNMKKFQAQLTWTPLLQLINLYAKGVLKAKLRQADSPVQLNSLTKTGVNAAFFLFKAFAKYIFRANTPLFQADAWAESAARSDYEELNNAIHKFADVIYAGIDKGEPWAIEGDLKKALEKLDNSTVELLNKRLCLSQINEILNVKDLKGLYQKLIELALEERSNPLGFFGGNTKDRSVWNYTGRINNLYFTKSVLAFLHTKATTGNDKDDQALHDQASALRADMKGNGGGFENWLVVGGTNLLCLGGLLCKPAPVFKWSDEDAQVAFGRMLEFGIMLWGGGKSIGRLVELWGLRGIEEGLGGVRGWRLVGRVWKQAAWDLEKGQSIWNRLRLLYGKNLLAGGKWGEALRRAREEAELLEEGFPNASVAGNGRWGRFWKRFKKFKLIKELPPLTPEEKAKLALLQRAMRTARAGASKATDKSFLATWVITGRAAWDADEAMFPDYNHAEVDREIILDDPPLDPIKPDPALYPAPAK